MSDINFYFDMFDRKSSSSHEEMYSFLIRNDLKLVLSGIPALYPIYPYQRSIYRSEEYGDVTERLLERNKLIISGPMRIGKSTLLYQIHRIIGEKFGNQRAIFSLDRQGLASASADEVTRSILTQKILIDGKLQRPEPSSIGKLVDLLAEKEGVLLIDELTSALPDEKLRKQYHPLSELIHLVIVKNVPIAIVVHSGNIWFDKLYKEFPELKDTDIIIPRDLTTDEIKQAMTQTVMWSEKSMPKKTSVLTVSIDTAKELAKVCGLKPININLFLQKLYESLIDEIPKDGEITPKHVWLFWDSNRGDLVRFEYGGMSNYAMAILKEEGQLKEFMHTFSIPTDRKQVTWDRNESSKIPISKVSEETGRYWQNLGLVRQEDDQLVIDGIWPELLIASNYQQI